MTGKEVSIFRRKNERDESEWRKRGEKKKRVTAKCERG